MNGFTENDWTNLLEDIEAGSCLPVLGAGASFGVIDTAATIAEQWAKDLSYPLPGTPNLVQIAQYYAMRKGSMAPKTRLIRDYGKVVPPDGLEPQATLAALGLPLFLTTNYDNFIERSLLSFGRQPRYEICNWNYALQQSAHQRPAPGPPTANSPIVYHLHGRFEEPISMVITEDDYLEFLFTLMVGHTQIPRYLSEAMLNCSLLFIGYSLVDTTYRVLHRQYVLGQPEAVSMRSYAVFPSPIPKDATDEQRKDCEEYFAKYFDNLRITPYYGTGVEFATELKVRLGKDK